MGKNQPKGVAKALNLIKEIKLSDKKISRDFETVAAPD
jgi:hypothetical protein